MKTSSKAVTLSICAGLAALLGGQGTAVAAACPNEAIRESQASESLPLGSTYLPGCMALEMVSPPHHFGQETREITAFSRDGARALFRSKAALAGTEGLQAFAGDSYVASRGTDSWQTAPTSAPASAQITGGIDPLQGGPFAFGPELDAWTLFGATQQQRYAGEGQFFAGGLGGVFGPLSPPVAATDDSGGMAGGGMFLIDSQLKPTGTAADTSSSVFAPAQASTTYLPGDPVNGAEANSYLAFRDGLGQPSLQLLSRDANGKVWGGRCGSHLGGSSTQGAISPDGDRIYLTTRPAQPAPSPAEEAEGVYPACNAANPQRILVRSQGAPGAGPQISELIPTGPVAGSDTFRGASADGQMVYLTTSRALVPGDGDSSSDLYLYDFSRPEGDRLVQVSAGEDTGSHVAGTGANVASVVAVSTDGSHVYFTAIGQLTGAANPLGVHAASGQSNLYLYDADNGSISFVGALALFEVPAAEAAPMLNPARSAEAGDGHILALLSKAPLAPAEDADGGRADVYRYDSVANTLACVSCVSPGPDTAPFEVFAGSTAGNGSNFAEQGRWASEDGLSFAFATAEPLEAGDEDGEVNPYLRYGDRLARLPAAIPGGVQPFKLPTVSVDGEEVGFITAAALLPQDGDDSRDAYAARVDGGFPNPTAPPACDPLSESSCQGSPSSAPSVSSAATGTFSGPGNAASHRRCRGGKTRRHGRCVKRKGRKHARTHRHHHKSKKEHAKKHHKRADKRRGGSK